MNTNKLAWNCSVAEISHAHKIALRACEEAKTRLNVKLDAYLVFMDILTAHCNGTPMNLLQLLMSAPADFESDVTGIGCNLDRQTGQLKNGFKPRFAQKQQLNA